MYIYNDRGTYICMHAYMYTYICMHTHTYSGQPLSHLTRASLSHTHIHTYIHTCVHTYIQWTAIESFDQGIPVTLIGESVFARCLSSLKEDRVAASKILAGPASTNFSGDKVCMYTHIEHVSKCRECARIHLCTQEQDSLTPCVY